MTIIMIAHRISTIQSADNLLYLEDSSSVLEAEKGTEEYDRLINLIVTHNYAHQKDSKKEEQTAEVKKDDEVTDVEDKKFNRDRINAPKKEQIISLEDLKKIKTLKATASANTGW